jgi:hypothetical protein
MRENLSTISTAQAAARLNEVGLPVTASSIRRWCAQEGFGIRLMGRWRIPEIRIAELEHKLRSASEEVPPCCAPMR